MTRLVRSLAFRLWIGRVLHYTLRIAVRGHEFADAYLHEMVAASDRAKFKIVRLDDCDLAEVHLWIVLHAVKHLIFWKSHEG